MAERFILNETAYFGRGSRAELANEIKSRNFKKVLVVTDGMIEGITNRIVGLSSFHMQVAQVRTYNDTDENFSVLQEIAKSVKKHPNVIN